MIVVFMVWLFGISNIQNILKKINKLWRYNKLSLMIIF